MEETNKGAFGHPSASNERSVDGYASAAKPFMASTLLSVNEVPEQFRYIFSEFRYFNRIQSSTLRDVLHTDSSLVISAPTGSGKTVIFELAIVRLLHSLELHSKNYKIVYIGPMKSLCEERVIDWHSKFSPAGVSCISVTGDSDDNIGFQTLQNHNLIITTPEKWDVLTRGWRKHMTFVGQVALFIIDEVHLLSDESRGATLEAIVSRMKTIEDSKMTTDNSVYSSKIRYIAASATIPNIEDIAEWIGSRRSPAKKYSFGADTRPVKLTTIVHGYTFNPQTSTPFKFDLMLSYKLQGLILQHSAGKPTLIFCNTRKSVEMTAKLVSSSLTITLNEVQRRVLIDATSTIDSSIVRELLVHGVGCHHAGMLLEWRRIVENLFRNGDLPVLVTTSTLAMGVNLPAHLVIVKTTKYYNKHELMDYSENQLLQMIGRAGRPQFDSTATAVILTTIADKHKFENMIGGSQPIESSLHKQLTEYLNAEVVLRTITDLGVAMQWLTFSFLHIRARKNPKHYGLSMVLTPDQIDKKLLDMCHIEINKLAKHGMIMIDENVTIEPTEIGSLMAKYYMKFETMKLFKQVTGTEILQQMLAIISKCHEFSDLHLRVNDKKALNLLNKCKGRETIRFPLSGKIKTADMKINCVIQAVFGCLQILDPSLLIDSQKIMRIGERVTKCLTEYLSSKPRHFSALLNALILAKCFHCKIWENSEYLCRQLAGIGAVLSTNLVAAGKVTFQSLLETNPRHLEMIIHRKSPMGNNILMQIKHLPRYTLRVEERKISSTKSRVKIILQLTNLEDVRDQITVDPSTVMNLLVGDGDNNILLYEKYSHNYMIDNPEIVAELNEEFDKNTLLEVHFISENWAGIDCKETLELFANPKKQAPAIKKLKTVKKVEKNVGAQRKPSAKQFIDQFFKKVKKPHAYSSLDTNNNTLSDFEESNGITTDTAANVAGSSNPNEASGKGENGERDIPRSYNNDIDRNQLDDNRLGNVATQSVDDIDEAALLLESESECYTSEKMDALEEQLLESPKEEATEIGASKNVPFADSIQTSLQNLIRNSIRQSSNILSLQKSEGNIQIVPLQVDQSSSRSEAAKFGNRNDGLKGRDENHLHGDKNDRFIDDDNVELKKVVNVLSNVDCAEFTSGMNLSSNDILNEDRNGDSYDYGFSDDSSNSNEAEILGNDDNNEFNNCATELNSNGNNLKTEDMCEDNDRLKSYGFYNSKEKYQKNTNNLWGDDGFRNYDVRMRSNDHTLMGNNMSFDDNALNFGNNNKLVSDDNRLNQDDHSFMKSRSVNLTNQDIQNVNNSKEKYQQDLQKLMCNNISMDPDEADQTKSKTIHQINMKPTNNPVCLDECSSMNESHKTSASILQGQTRTGFNPVLEISKSWSPINRSRNLETADTDKNVTFLPTKLANDIYNKRKLTKHSGNNFAQHDVDYPSKLSELQEKLSLPSSGLCIQISDPVRNTCGFHEVKTDCNNSSDDVNTEMPPPGSFDSNWNAISQNSTKLPMQNQSFSTSSTHSSKYKMKHESSRPKINYAFQSTEKNCIEKMLLDNEDFNKKNVIISNFSQTSKKHIRRVKKSESLYNEPDSTNDLNSKENMPLKRPSSESTRSVPKVVKWSTPLIKSPAGKRSGCFKITANFDLTSRRSSTITKMPSTVQHKSIRYPETCHFPIQTPKSTVDFSVSDKPCSYSQRSQAALSDIQTCSDELSASILNSLCANKTLDTKKPGKNAKFTDMDSYIMKTHCPKVAKAPSASKPIPLPINKNPRWDVDMQREDSSLQIDFRDQPLSQEQAGYVSLSGEKEQDNMDFNFTFGSHDAEQDEHCSALSVSDVCEDFQGNCRDSVMFGGINEDMSCKFELGAAPPLIKSSNIRAGAQSQRMEYNYGYGNDDFMGRPELFETVCNNREEFSNPVQQNCIRANYQAERELSRNPFVVSSDYIPTGMNIYEPEARRNDIFAHAVTAGTQKFQQPISNSQFQPNIYRVREDRHSFVMRENEGGRNNDPRSLNIYPENGYPVRAIDSEIAFRYNQRAPRFADQVDNNSWKSFQTYPNDTAIVPGNRQVRPNFDDQVGNNSREFNNFQTHPSGTIIAPGSRRIRSNFDDHVGNITNLQTQPIPEGTYMGYPGVRSGYTQNINDRGVCGSQNYARYPNPTRRENLSQPCFYDQHDVRATSGNPSINQEFRVRGYSNAFYNGADMFPTWETGNYGEVDRKFLMDRYLGIQKRPRM